MILLFRSVECIIFYHFGYMEFHEVFIKIYALHRLGAISFSIICMDDYIDWDVPKKTGFGNSTFLMTTK